MKDLLNLVPKHSHYFLLFFPACDLLLIILSAFKLCDCKPVFFVYFIKLLEKGEVYFYCVCGLLFIEKLFDFIIKLRKTN